MSVGRLQEKAVRVIDVARVDYQHKHIRRRVTIAILVGGLLVSCFFIAEVRPAALFEPEAIASIWRFIRSLFPPDLSFQFLSVVASAGLQTLAIAIVSTFLSDAF
jgi:ABC-type phosphate/phosphonate transport system permease subunit